MCVSDGISKNRQTQIQSTPRQFAICTHASTHAHTHLFCVPNRNLNGMGRLHGIQSHGSRQVSRGELIPHFVIGMNFVGAPIFGPAGESFVQPQVIPPCHGDQISEPLVGQFVSHDGAHALFLLVGCLLWITEQINFAISDESPVFHGTGRKLM